jgi:hypothetical protein
MTLTKHETRRAAVCKTAVMPRALRLKDIAIRERGSALEQRRSHVFLSVEARNACIGTWHAEMNTALCVKSNIR